MKEQKGTHSRLVEHGQQHVLSRTAREPERERAPVRMQQQIRVERIRVHDRQISRLVLWRRWRRDAFRHSCSYSKAQKCRSYQLADGRDDFGEKWHTFFFLSTASRRGERGGRGKVGKKDGEGGKGGYLSCFWCCEMNETGPFDERGPE